ncbi:LCP family protein [Kineosporia babensis]
MRHARGRVRLTPWGKIALGTVAVLMAGTAGGGAYMYQRLNGNIESSALFSGTTGDAGVQKADEQGRFPINVLVIGTDARSSEANCKLGGACDHTAANADVQILVHLSADRTNITAMSVPRDTLTQMPGCENAETGQSVSERYGQINGSLVYGPGCSVAAIHQLTGITIDHFVMVDFAGVIAMSDATGGVDVCVTDDVYDNYSHLKLSKGSHTLKGEAALQFVRTRHGFGDGSDLGRTYGQHAFLSAAIRSMKDTGTLLNPTKLYGVADAATKALTVDEGLDSIPKLIDLATELNKVDTKRITFTTMQSAPAPTDPNRVVPTEAAQKLFATIIEDQSLSKGPNETSTPSPSTSKASPGRDFEVQVRNRGGADGRAGEMTALLADQGYDAETDASAGDLETRTSIIYGKGQVDQAQQLAADLKMPSSLLTKDTDTDTVTLVLGQDWTEGDTYPKSTKKDRQEALADSNARAATKSECVPVSTQNTVKYNGVSMTPAEAYAQATDKKDSAS